MGHKSKATSSVTALLCLRKTDNFIRILGLGFGDSNVESGEKPSMLILKKIENIEIWRR